ncbi:hypothetical protein [Tahibacter amnicola]|uniref:Uncharacterized protein n=1 Tax=Tahibacter amnicola TaxID=2976241 RepID=A0ABY6BHI5_9GAMM|nr:hypothetical protein [Tahibacter amnicola]UXI69315.1 hypothetical protein N4264_06610 [Tahibacter amnicola]
MKIALHGVWMLVLALAGSTGLPAQARSPDALPYPPSCITPEHYYQTRNIQTGNVASDETHGYIQVPRMGAAGYYEDIRMYVSLRRIACDATHSVVQLETRDDHAYTITYGGLLPAIEVGKTGSDVFVRPEVTKSPTPTIAGDDVGYVFHEMPSNRYLLEWAEGVDLNGPITVRLSSPLGTTATLRLPGYVPPATFPNLPITSYVGGHYYDPAHPGEGIVIESLEGTILDGDVTPLRFEWFTYDNDGLPLFLVGAGSDYGHLRKVSAKAYYTSGGQFAGKRSADAPTYWGVVELSFPDCNTLRIRYRSNPSSDPRIPQGEGELVWKRLGKPSGRACD